MNDIYVIKIKTSSLIKLLIFDAQPIMTSQVLLDFWELRVSSRGCFISTLITRHNLSRHLTGDVSIFLTHFFLKGSTRAGNFFFFSKMKFKTSLWAKNLTLNRGSNLKIRKYFKTFDILTNFCYLGRHYGFPLYCKNIFFIFS